MPASSRRPAKPRAGCGGSGASYGVGKEGGVINTAFIERLNATFRQRLPWLTRRTRTLAQQCQTLTAAIYVVGALYNLCDYHHGLRVKLYTSPHYFKWVLVRLRWRQD